MAIENEPAKLLLPYLQRADELQKHEPLVAYYCRLYAMERGLRIPQSDRTKTTSALLVSLMKQLEKDKNSLKLGADDQLHIEGFSLSVFEKADNQDRAGRADLNTAKTFYAASIFFEILNQFGELHPDLEQKQKYAAWKAADIRKALKEGRKPVPGTPAGDKDHSMPSRTSISEYEVDSIRLGPSRTDTFERTVPGSYSSIKPHDHDNFQHPTNTSPPSTNFTSPPSLSISPPPRHPTDYHPSESFHQPPSINNSCPNFQSYPSFTDRSLPTAPSHYQEANSSDSNAALNPSHAEYNCIGRNSSVPEASPPSKQKYEYDSSYQPPPDKIAEAHKAARFAVGALAFDDVSVAVDHLKKSLELLTNPAAGL